MAEYFKRPFAENGDKVAIPTDTTLDESVSLEQGWTSAYQRDPATDLTAKRLERAKHNYLFNQITENIKEWQEQTFPAWIADAGGGVPFAYGKDAIVTYTDGRAYVSLVDANTGEPIISNDWALFDFVELQNSINLKQDKFTFLSISTNYTASPNDFIYCDTSAGSITITLPATPIANDVVAIMDNTASFETNPLTVARNGNNIMGLAEDMVVDVNNISFELIYNGTEWRLK